VRRVDYSKAHGRPDEQQSFGSRFFSQSKRKRELEDAASMATSTKNNNGAGTDRKIFAVNQNISNVKSVNTNRKTVMFKQPLKYYDKSQGSMENIQKPVM